MERYHLMMMMMRLVTSFLGLLAVTPTRTHGYEKYIVVERDCGSGNLTVHLDGVGPTSAALLRSTERTSYSLAMDCVLLLVAPESHRIVVSVREVGFRVRANGVCQDYLEINQRPQCSNLYRKDEELHFRSDGSTMEMLYHVSKDGMDNHTFSGEPGFQVVATAYTTGDHCSGEEDVFHCDNYLCVWAGLKCDTHNNCGDLSDERKCGGDIVGGGSSSTVLIILGALILLLLIIMCVATLLCSKNENVRRFSNRIRSRTMSFVRRFSK